MKKSMNAKSIRSLGILGTKSEIKANQCDLLLENKEVYLERSLEYQIK